MINAPPRISAAPELLETVRLAIGQHLKVAFDVPRDLPPPPRMVALVMQLDQGNDISHLNFD
jgi:hypothetical protein